MPRCCAQMQSERMRTTRLLDVLVIKRPTSAIENNQQEIRQSLLDGIFWNHFVIFWFFPIPCTWRPCHRKENYKKETKIFQILFKRNVESQKNSKNRNGLMIKRHAISVYRFLCLTLQSKPLHLSVDRVYLNITSDGFYVVYDIHSISDLRNLQRWATKEIKIRTFTNKKVKFFLVLLRSHQM